MQFHRLRHSLLVSHTHAHADTRTYWLPASFSHHSHSLWLVFLISCNVALLVHRTPLRNTSFLAASFLYISILPAEMKILPDSPLPSAIPGFRSSLRSRSLSYEIEICTESLRAVHSSRACEAYGDRIDDSLSPRIASRRSGYGDGKGFYAAKLQFCSPHRLEAGLAGEDDDENDDMQWANSKEPLETALQGSDEGFSGEKLDSYNPHQVKARQADKDADDEDIRLPNTTNILQSALQSSGYGDGKGLCAKKIASGKEIKARFPCKPASYSISIAMQQHSGPIKPNSGPFSGPLKAVAKPNSVAKPSHGPSIIPINLLRRKVLGFSLHEPTSPKVTCLGRVKIKEIYGKDLQVMTDDKLTPAITPGRCFDTKNQLCGRKNKGRKKKVAEKARCLSRRRRFALKEVTDSNSFPSSETVQTRREKAASLANSLSGLLEDVRRLEKGDTHYVPSVPPRNSLLLMRGDRGQIVSSRGPDIDEITIDDDRVQEHVESSTLVEDVSSAANVRKLRNSAPPHFSLLDLIDMEENIINKDLALTEDTMTARGIPAIVQSSSLLVDKENCATVEGNEMMNNQGSFSPPPSRGAILLWQRRSIAELRAIEVRQCTRVKIKQPPSNNRQIRKF